MSSETDPLSSLPEPVGRVAAFLRRAGAEVRIEEFRGGTPTAADAAAAVGCELDQIVKSLLFLCDGGPVLVLVPGSRRADPAKVAAAVDAGAAKIAPPGVVKSITGFEAGGVAPFPVAADHVLVERLLLSFELLWAGAGSDRHMLALAPAELLRLTRARPIDACVDT